MLNIRNPMKGLWIIPLLAAAAGGCGGNLKCSFVSANMQSIMVRPTDARVVRMDCPECYWWVGDDKRVNIAGRGIAKSLISKHLDQEFYISFVLDEPSKGVAKDYPLNQASVRGFVLSGGNVYRFQSTYGLLGSENEKANLVAAYRSNIALSGAKIFGGWSQPAAFLIFGTLTAVPDTQGRGKAIRAKTEEEGYARRFVTLPRYTVLPLSSRPAKPVVK